MDEDSWGYLDPAFSKLTGGYFVHRTGRNFLYPGFVFVVLCAGGFFEVLGAVQHCIGLLTGVVLAMTWNVLCGFLKGTERARTIARSFGLLLVANYLFSRSQLLLEQTIRPEAVFPFFLALSFWLNFTALRAWLITSRWRVVRWCLGANLVVVYAALSLKPSMGFGAVAANLPLACWLWRGREPWRRKLRVVGVGLAVIALTLWLPEKRLAQNDANARLYLPTMLFSIHAPAIHAQIVEDLRRGDTAPYKAAWLADFNRVLERSLAAAGKPENAIWPALGFNADYLLCRDPVFPPFFARVQEQQEAAFCLHYYWRTWRHRPGEMFAKVIRQLRLVYKFDPRDIKRLGRITDSYTGKVQRPMSYDYKATVICTEQLSSRLEASRYGAAYLRRLHRLEATKAVFQQPVWIGWLNNLLRFLDLPLLVLAALAGTALLQRPGTGDALLVGSVWLCGVTNFAMFLTVAVAHTLEIDRYVQNQRLLTLLTEYAAALLFVYWVLSRRKRPTIAAPETHPEGDPAAPVPLPAATTDAGTHEVTIPTASLRSCQDLNQILVEYRHLPVAGQLANIGNKHSMLHRDVLTLLYHGAKAASGAVLEIGPYLGGSTIALAWGVRASAHPQGRVTTVESGGQHLTHPTLPSDDILRDLKRNLEKRGVAETVTLIEGHSTEKAVGRQLRSVLRPGSVEMLFLDADGEVQRDVELFGDLLREDCLLIVDDYYAPGLLKAGPTRAAIDDWVASGKVEAYGIFGFGTWIGRRVPTAKPPAPVSEITPPPPESLPLP